MAELPELGFFNLHEDNVCEDDTDEKRLIYWLETQEHLLTLVPADSAERNAMKNLIGLFLYLLPDTKHKAKEYFECILEDTKNNSLNTMANLLHIYKESDLKHETRYDEISTKFQETKCEDSESSKLEMARAICEQGYCKSFYNEEGYCIDLNESKIAVQLLKEGICQGQKYGMSQNEINVWRYYLFRSMGFLLSIERESNLTDDTYWTDLRNIFVMFHDFYTNAGNECNFHKARALVYVSVLVRVFQEDIEESKELENLFQQEGILSEILETNYNLQLCKQALAMSPKDHYIPCTMSHMCLKSENKERYIDMSLDLNSETNMYGIIAKMAHYSEKAHAHALHNETVTTDLLMQAYKCGRTLLDNKKYMSNTCVAEMMRVCYNLAVNRQTKPWTVKHSNRHYLMEALELGRKAVKTRENKGYGRVFGHYAQCLWLIGKQHDTIHYLHEAVARSNAMETTSLKQLLYYYSQLYKHERKLEIVESIAELMETSYNRFRKSALQDVLLISANSTLLQSRLIIGIWDELGHRSTQLSKDVLKFICKMIAENECKEPWLKSYCQHILHRQF